MASIGTGGIRLQKFLSSAGLASRRKAEDLITEGRVTVNGKLVVELGTKVNPARDSVEVDGLRVRSRPPVYVVMHKPKGTVCSERDPEGRARVHDLLPKDLPRVFTVGRLDWDTEGVLLFTNDGDLAKALTDPVLHIPRVYRVKIQGAPDPHIIRRFNEGVRLPTGYRTRPAPIELIQRTDTNAWYEVVLSEGKNRQIHRMTEACGRRVLKLVRVSYGAVKLGSLPPGKCRLLTPDEVKGLEQAVGLERERLSEADLAAWSEVGGKPGAGAPRPGARATYTRSRFGAPAPAEGRAKSAKPSGATKTSRDADDSSFDTGRPARRPAGGKTAGRAAEGGKAGARGGKAGGRAAEGTKQGARGAEATGRKPAGRSTAAASRAAPRGGGAARGTTASPRGKGKPSPRRP